MLSVIISSLRIKQWVKNLLVFAPLVFSREFLNPQAIKISVIAFCAFCLASSGVYLMNDVFDKASDAKHPLKKKRGVASGKIPLPLAIFLSATLFLLAFIIPYFYAINCWIIDILFFYMLLHFAYSAYFKHVVILDLIFIASGFILRIFGGGVVIGVEISSWLLAITFLLALLLGSGKRLREIETNGVSSRKVLESYSIDFLQSIIKVLIPTILVSYLFYSFQASDSRYFIATTPIVTYGLLRYLLIIDRKSSAENPTDLLFEDKPLLASVVIWLASVVGILYYG